jgi:hypothetical protein
MKMADVTISYGGQTITSLSDSGTEVLETSGTFLTDDITIDYVKSGGGGGGTKTVNIAISPRDLIWVDGDGTAHTTAQQSQSTISIVCLSGSLIIFTYGMMDYPPGTVPTVTNAQSVITINNGSRADKTYTCVYQVD